MQYGLSLPNGGPWGDARTLAELSQLAEDSGWNGVFLEDYIVWQGDQSVPTYDPWVALAAIAMQTKHIRLGTKPPDDIRTFRDFIQGQRGSLQGYDIAVGGSPRRSDWEKEREHIRSLAEAGITWWTEYIPPDSGDLETVQGFIKRGPLFIS